MPAKATPKPVRVLTGNNAPVLLTPYWRGAALCVHAPLKDGAPNPTRGVWTISHAASGYAAGTYRGPVRDAVALARLWDAEFSAALPDGVAVSLANWPQRRAWTRQCARETAPIGPVDPSHPDYADGAPVVSRPRVAAADGDGAEQFPATPTITRGSRPGLARYARRLANGRERLRDADGRAVRMIGDIAAFKGADPLTPVLRLWWDGQWIDVPTIAELMEWSFDGVAETPDGSRVEPDATDSWLSLLGLV